MGGKFILCYQRWGGDLMWINHITNLYSQFSRHQHLTRQRFIASISLKLDLLILLQLICHKWQKHKTLFLLLNALLVFSGCWLKLPWKWIRNAPLRLLVILLKQAKTTLILFFFLSVIDKKISFYLIENYCFDHYSKGDSLARFDLFCLMAYRLLASAKILFICKYGF